ncbi:MAG: hypothetical protein GC136_09145 [Alphaproteobacteria bacterium]|nr:hypothetical protein [Alphaproteobacteria bacterium]
MKFLIAIFLLCFMAFGANAAVKLDKSSSNNYSLYVFMNGCKDQYYQDFELGLLRQDQIPRLKKHTEDACLCLGRTLFTQFGGAQVLKFSQSYFGSGTYNPSDTQAILYATGAERKVMQDYLNDANRRESCQYFGVFR